MTATRATAERAALAPDGFRMPGEWERHEATWMGWPHNEADWPGKFEAIPWVFGEMVRHLTRGEIVRMLVNDAAHEQAARDVLLRVGVDIARVEFFRFATNRNWTRDFGPMFVQRSGAQRELAIAKFRFNAWARYSNWQLDDAVAEQAADVLGCSVVRARLHDADLVLEGGAIDVNGAGTLITTEECLLDQRTQVRNPGSGRQELEGAFATVLGAHNVIWLGRGIAGDDTHGHVDDLCRFVNSRTVVLCQEEDPSDSNYGPLQENRERLQSARLEDGSSIDVIPLPMPQPLYFEGERLPASYANFYIANAAVLVPTFNDPRDRLALGILSEIFTDRPVVGIHAVDLAWGFGTVHCLTQQQPEG